MNTSQKNISFYSHRAENFAVYIYPSIHIQSTARTVPSDFTGKRDSRDCLGFFQCGSVWVQHWPKNQLFFSHSTLPASSTAPSISLPATDIKMFCWFKTWFRTAVYRFFFFFTSSSPRSASSKNVQTVRSTHCILKTRMGPGNLEATDSRWATSGVFQSQRKFHMVCRWAKWCTWWPWARSLCPSPVTCPTELPERKSQRSCWRRTSPASQRVHSVLARVLLFGRTVEQARKYFRFSLAPSLKWWPGPCLSEKKATRETRKTEPHWKPQQVLMATLSLKTTISAFLISKPE